VVKQHRRGIFEHLINWGPNTALALPVGFEGKLLEVTGQAWQTYQQEVNTCDNEMMVALAGQVVTTTGGTGFAIREAAVTRAKRPRRDRSAARPAERRFTPEAGPRDASAAIGRRAEKLARDIDGCSVALAHRICAGISYADVT
jgi:hypothetical protein